MVTHGDKRRRSFERREERTEMTIT